MINIVCSKKIHVLNTGDAKTLQFCFRENDCCAVGWISTFDKVIPANTWAEIEFDKKYIGKELVVFDEVIRKFDPHIHNPGVLFSGFIDNKERRSPEVVKRGTLITQTWNLAETWGDKHKKGFLAELARMPDMSFIKQINGKDFDGKIKIECKDEISFLIDTALVKGSYINTFFHFDARGLMSSGYTDFTLIYEKEKELTKTLMKLEI